MAVEEKAARILGHLVSGTSACVSLVSVLICVHRGVIDGLAFVSCSIVVIDAEQGVYSSPLASKVGNYANVIKCWFHTI